MLFYGETSARINDPELSDSMDLEYLVGISHTFNAGPTLACEYFTTKTGKQAPSIRRLYRRNRRIRMMS